MASPTTIAQGFERRRDNFLWLRILAALMVIYGHSFPLVPQSGSQDIFLAHGWDIYSGDIAVDIFFVISGFLVSASYGRRGGLVPFMKARLLRLVPALLLCVSLTALVMGPLVTTLASSTYFHSSQVAGYIFDNLRFSAGMAYHLPGVFQTNAYEGVVNGSLWTLPAELRMYELVAVIGAIGLLRNRILLTVVLAGMTAIGVAAPAMLPLPPDWVHLAGYFGLGIIMQLYRDRIGISHEAMVALAFLAYWSHGSALYPFLFAVALAYFCVWFGYGITLPNIERYGDPSYGTYLWGWPLLQIFAWRFPDASPQMAFVACGAGALILGYASWHLVERRALRLKSVRLLSIVSMRRRHAVRSAD